MTTSEDCEGYHRSGVYDLIIKLDCIEWGWRPHRRINDYVTCVLQSLRIGISSAPTFGNEYGTQPLPFYITMMNIIIILYQIRQIRYTGHFSRRLRYVQAPTIATFLFCYNRNSSCAKTPSILICLAPDDSL